MMLQQLFREWSLRFCRMGPGFPVHVELYVSHRWGGERARGETHLPPEQPKALGRWVMSLARRGAVAGPSRSSPPTKDRQREPRRRDVGPGWIYSQIWICPTRVGKPCRGYRLCPRVWCLGGEPPRQPPAAWRRLL